MTTQLFAENDVTFADGKTPYALGPLNMEQVTCIARRLDNDLDYTLLVPTAFPAAMHQDPDFLAACEFGYTCYDEQPTSPIKLANWVHRELYDNLVNGEGDFDLYLFSVGFLFGWLSGLAETDQTLALVGVMHLCFLLSYIPPSLTGCRLVRAFRRVDSCHIWSLKAYRARLRKLASQGVALREAYQRALTIYVSKEQ